MKTTASQILKQLENKHRDDVFVDECKDGPSQGISHSRMDAWAMKRSWTNPVTYGYEIKVSRSDFTNDEKWRFYLDYCSQFYFVCPNGLIKPDELPQEAGLMWLAKTGTRLFIKKKAPQRAVEIPETLWRYLVMSRAKITRDRFDRGEEDDGHGAEHWAKLVRDRRIRKRIGSFAATKIREHVNRVELENSQLQSRIKQYEKIKKALVDRGIDEKDHASEWKLKAKLPELLGDLPNYFTRYLKQAKAEISNVLKLIESEKT